MSDNACFTAEMAGSGGEEATGGGLVLEGCGQEYYLLSFGEFGEGDQLRLGLFHACGLFARGGGLFPQFQVQWLMAG